MFLSAFLPVLLATVKGVSVPELLLWLQPSKGPQNFTAEGSPSCDLTSTASHPVPIHHVTGTSQPQQASELARKEVLGKGLFWGKEPACQGASAIRRHLAIRLLGWGDC